MTTTTDRWLDSIPNPNTRRQYAAGLASFMAHAGLASDDQLQRATGRQVRAWLNALRDSAASPATVNSRRAALAAFYRYTETIEGWPANPAAKIRSARVTAYGRSSYPTTDQVRTLLAAIPATPAGQRDLAIILGMYATTRRIAEWLPLRWCDIQHAGAGYWFTYTAKGGDVCRQAIPHDLWQVIVAQAEAFERWPLRDEYLFVSGRGRPLTAGYIRLAIKRYGKIADLPANICHPHGLRHAGARARRAAGQSPWELQEVLSHKNIQTTMIYAHRVLDEPVDAVGNSIVSAVLPAPRRPDSR
jgi:site-specific recombinase XerD